MIKAIKWLRAFIFWRGMVPLSKYLPDGKERLKKHSKDFIEEGEYREHNT